MSRHWSEVKEEIENEIDRIWWNKPEEFLMAEKGWFHSGAGTDGSAIGNLTFLISDTASIGRHVVEPAMWAVIADDSIDVKTIKTFWRHLTGGTARLLGSSAPPNCPAPWLNLPKVWKFYCEIIETYDTIVTKEDFFEIYYSWANYLTCLNRWAMICFPWEYIWNKVPKCQTDPDKVKQ